MGCQAQKTDLIALRFHFASPSFFAFSRFLLSLLDTPLPCSCCPCEPFCLIGWWRSHHTATAFRTLWNTPPPNQCSPKVTPAKCSGCVSTPPPMRQNGSQGANSRPLTRTLSAQMEDSLSATRTLSAQMEDSLSAKRPSSCLCRVH